MFVSRPCLLITGVAIGLSILSGCAAPEAHTAASAASAYQQSSKLTWGATPSAVAQLQSVGLPAYVNAQLHPGAQRLPAAVQAQIDAMTIVQQPLLTLVQNLEQRRKVPTP
jgi:hypothetical protein